MPLVEGPRIARALFTGTSDGSGNLLPKVELKRHWCSADREQVARAADAHQQWSGPTAEQRARLPQGSCFERSRYRLGRIAGKPNAEIGKAGVCVVQQAVHRRHRLTDQIAVAALTNNIRQQGCHDRRGSLQDRGVPRSCADHRSPGTRT